MRPIKFEGQNIVYKCPPEIPNCDPLPVKKEVVGNRTQLTSVWVLDSVEMEAIIQAYKCGHGAAVQICIYTDVQPVIALNMVTVR